MRLGNRKGDHNILGTDTVNIVVGFHKPGMPCAHNGCIATVHKLCQLNWLEKMNREIDVNGGRGKKFVVDRNGPFFYPEHNIQRTDYITKRERLYIPKKAS